MTNKGKDGSPSYSLHFRSKPIRLFNTPSPCAYTRNCNDKKKAPSFSFGQKLAMRKTDNTPSPNAYTLPAVFNKTIQSQMKQSPQSTMAPRNDKALKNSNSNPGPGSYNIVDINLYNKKPPAFSMLGNRTDILIPRQAYTTPGPGQYLSLKGDQTRKQAAHFSFGVKHSPYITPALFDLDV